MTPKFCRIAVLVDDMDAFTQEVGRLLGARFVVPTLIAQLYPDAGFKVTFGEHGLEPIQQAPDGTGFAKDGRLIEVAIDVDDAEAVRAKLEAAGHRFVADSYLPEPDAHEYLFGRDFCGIPFLVCTAGDNEVQMRSQGPFNYLEDAPPPKIARVTLVVDDAAAVAADLGKYLGMRFVETDADGFGRKALGGTHRVRLIEGPAALLDGVERPLASIDFVVDDVEAARRRFEEAGYKVRHSIPLSSGGNGYYFGETVQAMPVSLYPVSADAELRDPHVISERVEA
jgi:catechol 2,3-dioxygenase-like lactoylglutathione lyase family enzyme